MKVRLTDIRTNREEVTFGTCEECMSTGETEEDTFTVTTSDGSVAEVDAFYWDWGDFYNIDVDNIPKFMYWVNQQEFEVETIKNVHYQWLEERADDYRRQTS